MPFFAVPCSALPLLCPASMKLVSNDFDTAYICIWMPGNRPSYARGIRLPSFSHPIVVQSCHLIFVHRHMASTITSLQSKASLKFQNPILTKKKREEEASTNLS
ncbi:hypothetical protein BU24DRAFT_249239 [Aaosphaeria arxii CBS 175.79]|uniref:Uncharacterized protein n=1 Tax=Aaosphaeria arxii CBS 175.79 TaxID=1450172 RepID=A0A6A5XNF1_9PLEO|nr:uncharacterized protein BU24DRAFT_249239 [Aaosphaeria arxii CBS 175.79]KAF2013884.1 hypothetical protein BU24DRAFT_249239 [Aaosphaeria arxii CBS 175.79]